MTRPASSSTRHPDDLVPLPDDATVPTDDESSRVVARPDGFYWVADDGRAEFGPFPTAEDALVALRTGIDSGLESDQTVAEAEAEIGFVEPADADGDRPED
jgi:hypothetical protein